MTQWDSGGQLLSSVGYTKEILCPVLRKPQLLSQRIAKSRYGYQFQCRHLLYFSDIKLYARNEQYIDLLIHLNRMNSRNFEMIFGLAKCIQMVSKRDKMTTA